MLRTPRALRALIPEHASTAMMATLVDRLGVRKDNLWVDDLKQAAIIALWAAAPLRDGGHAWAVARSAMVDELRRLTPGSRAASQRKKIPPPLPSFVPLEEAESVPHGETPETILQAQQQADSVDARKPGLVWALAFARQRQDVAHLFDVSPSRVSQLAADLKRALA